MSDLNDRKIAEVFANAPAGKQLSAVVEEVGRQLAEDLDRLADSNSGISMPGSNYTWTAVRDAAQHVRRWTETTAGD